MWGWGWGIHGWTRMERMKMEGWGESSNPTIFRCDPPTDRWDSQSVIPSSINGAPARSNIAARSHG